MSVFRWCRFGCPMLPMAPYEDSCFHSGECCHSHPELAPSSTELIKKQKEAYKEIKTKQAETIKAEAKRKEAAEKLAGNNSILLTTLKEQTKIEAMTPKNKKKDGKKSSFNFKNTSLLENAEVLIANTPKDFFTFDLDVTPKLNENESQGLTEMFPMTNNTNVAIANQSKLKAFDKPIVAPSSAKIDPSVVVEVVPVISPRSASKGMDPPITLERMSAVNSNEAKLDINISSHLISNSSDMAPLEAVKFEANPVDHKIEFKVPDSNSVTDIIDVANNYPYFYQLALHSPFGISYDAKNVFQFPRYISNTVSGLDHSLWAVQGCRNYMEDRHRVMYDFGVQLSINNPMPAMINGFFGVFDGHTGWMASQYAAQFLPDCLFAHMQLLQMESKSDKVNWKKLLPTAFKRSFDQIEYEILQHSTQFVHDAGSTACCCVIVDGCVYTANVGDSRCVMARRLPADEKCESKSRTFLPKGCLPHSVQGLPGAHGESCSSPVYNSFGPLEFDSVAFMDGFVDVSKERRVADSKDIESSDFVLDALELSHDHKPARSDEKVRIEKQGGTIGANPRQMQYCGCIPYTTDGPVRVRPGGLSLSRTLGDQSSKQAEDSIGIIVHEPEITVTPVDSSSLFIIFGSDGIWDVMSSQDAVEYVYRKIMEGVPYRDVAKKLVERALAIGSKDNITALVVFFCHW